MDDGNVYYKILNMIKEYYICADKCYMLEDIPKKIDIYHYSTSGDFLSVEMLVKIDVKMDGLPIANRVNSNKFVSYPLEKDE